MSMFRHLISGVHNVIYVEIYKALLKLGKIISLREIGKGYIGIKEEYINSQLQRVCDNDSGVKSLRISCKKNNGLFYLELKRFLIKGIIEIPFQVDSFTFNSDIKEITFRIGKEKTFAKDYYSRLLLWFTLTVIGAFNNKNDLMKYAFKENSYLKKNPDGTYTVDLENIPELNDSFKKPYWKLIRIDGILLDSEIVLLQLHKDFAEKIVFVSNEVGSKVKEAKEWSDGILKKLDKAVRGKKTKD